MISKFLKLYDLVMEDLGSKRKPIQKVNQMGPKDFLNFLKELFPYIKDGKVDLNDVRISEKIDGNSIKLLTLNGEMLFESSYSGITTFDKYPTKEAGQFLYNNYSQLFKDIHDSIGSDFKIIGELIWIDSMEKSKKVTPVGASYLTEKFGKHGGIVIFDILKIDNNKLIPFEKEKEEEIFNMIRDLNNEDFSFYLTESIDITKNVVFDLNVDELQNLISNPEFNKDKFNRKSDEKILNEIDKIKKDVCAQLSKTIENTKGAFSEKGDLIEGIVVKINSSGNQYGMFSDGYKDLKNKYWKKFEDYENVVNDFYKSIFGCTKKMLRRHVPNLDDKYKVPFEQAKEKYIPILTKMLDDIKNDDTIPIGVRGMNLTMGQKDLNNINVSYEEFRSNFNG